MTVSSSQKSLSTPKSCSRQDGNPNRWTASQPVGARIWRRGQWAHSASCRETEPSFRAPVLDRSASTADKTAIRSRTPSRRSRRSLRAVSLMWAVSMPAEGGMAGCGFERASQRSRFWGATNPCKCQAPRPQSGAPIVYLLTSPTKRPAKERSKKRRRKEEERKERKGRKERREEKRKEEEKEPQEWLLMSKWLAFMTLISLLALAAVVHIPSTL